MPTLLESIGGTFPPLPRTIAGLEAQGVSAARRGASARPELAVLSAGHGRRRRRIRQRRRAEHRWAGLRTRDDMRAEVNAGGPTLRTKVESTASPAALPIAFVTAGLSHTAAASLHHT